MPDDRTENLVREWEVLERELEVAKKALDRILEKHSKAKEALSKWLLPDDAKEDERFHIWINGKLLEIEWKRPLTSTGKTEIRVKWRAEGKEYQSQG